MQADFVETNIGNRVPLLVRCTSVGLMNTWRLIAHHKDPESAISWLRDQRRIAIGWGRIGDLRTSCVRAATDITAMVRKKYPKAQNGHLGGPSLWRFYDKMLVGDLVIVGDGQRRVAELVRARDQFFRMRGPGEKGEVAAAMQLGVGGQAQRARREPGRHAADGGRGHAPRLKRRGATET